MGIGRPELQSAHFFLGLSTGVRFRRVKHIDTIVKSCLDDFLDVHIVMISKSA